MKIKNDISIEIADNKSLHKKSQSDIKQDNLKMPFKKSNQKKKIFFIIIVFIVVSFIFFLYLKQSGEFLRILIHFERHLKLLTMKKPILSYLILFMLIFSIILFALPGHVIISIFCSIIISDFWKSFFFLFFSGVLSSLFVFLSSRFICNKLFIDVFQDFKIVHILETEAKTSPLKISFIVRCLFFSVGLKEYILIILQIPFFAYFFTLIFFNALHSLINSAIALEFTAINDFVKDPKYWHNQSSIQKICFFVVCFSILFSISLMIYIGIWMKKKIDVEKIKSQNKGYQNIEEHN